MKTTKLVVLTAVVLFGLALSSCKNCNENKSKGKDNGEDNLVIDRDKDKDKSKDNLDNPAIDEGESVPSQAKAIESEVEVEVRKLLENIAEGLAVAVAAARWGGDEGRGGESGEGGGEDASTTRRVGEQEGEGN